MCWGPGGMSARILSLRSARWPSGRTGSGMARQRAHARRPRTPLNNPRALDSAFAGIVFDHLG